MNRYEFKEASKAKELISKIREGKGIKVFDVGIVVINADESGIKETTNYLVDVLWNSEQPEEWKEFEVFPENPINKF